MHYVLRDSTFEAQSLVLTAEYWLLKLNHFLFSVLLCSVIITHPKAMNKLCSSKG